jgi:hypothetical protein
MDNLSDFNTPSSIADVSSLEKLKGATDSLAFFGESRLVDDFNDIGFNVDNGRLFQ